MNNVREMDIAWFYFCKRRTAADEGLLVMGQAEDDEAASWDQPPERV